MNQSHRNIFINATATQPGGGYTILLQFLNAYAEKPIPYTNIYVFNSIGIGENMSPVIIPVNIPRLNGLQRIYWDWKGMKKWSEKHNINPDLILSFQNTGVRFNKVPQVIYLQQSIPFVAHQWNPFKKSERSLWMYKNIYPFFIGINLFKHTHMVVQAEWMKRAFLKKFPRHDSEKVYVFSPEISKIDAAVLKEPFIEEPDSPHPFAFFYPATPLLYKNHIEIIKAFAAIKKDKKQWDVQCFFTTSFEDLSEEARQLIKTNELYPNFVFLGALSLPEVYSYYRKANALIFPSYIETIGLPLIESAGFGLPVLVADEPYSREVLAKYDNVAYAKTKDTDDWESKIVQMLKSKRTRPRKINTSEKSWPEMIQLLASLIKN